MTLLNLHGTPVETSFHLIGNDENALTKSLGWCLSRVPSFLDSLGRTLGTPDLSKPDTIVKLQEHQSEQGITDLEIHAPGYAAWIIEAKCGFTIPTVDQLKRYAGRLTELQAPDASRGLVVLTAMDGNDPWLSQQLPNEICGVPVHAISWRRIQRMAESARRGANHANARLLRQFQTYLGMEATMRNWNDNRVYVVSLKHDTFGGSTTFVDVVEKHRKYFCPVRLWPKPNPNYLGFRYDAHVQSIHHVEDYRIVTDLGPIFNQPSDDWGPRWLFQLGPKIGPPEPMPVRMNLVAARRWCFIDLLFTSSTFSEALDAHDARKRRIDGTEDE